MADLGVADGAAPAKKAPTAKAAAKQSAPPKRVAVTYTKNGTKVAPAAAAAAGAGAAAAVAAKASASTNGSATGLDVKSSAVLVYDVIDGRALYAKNIEQVSSIASITKLMTAIVVLDAGLPLDEPIRIERSDIDDPFLVYQLAAGRSLVLRGVARFGEEVTRPLLDPDQVGRVFRAIT